MRAKKAIGPRLHAKASKATAQVTTLDEGVALALLAFPEDTPEHEHHLTLTLHSLLASDPCSAEDPTSY
jgi:hypothetical protein